MSEPIVVNPCAMCTSVLRIELEQRGEDSMARMVAPLIMRCPTCNQQLPQEKGVFHLGSKLRLNLPDKA